MSKFECMECGNVVNTEDHEFSGEDLKKHIACEICCKLKWKKVEVETNNE